jgi:hypothetical protein
MLEDVLDDLQGLLRRVVRATAVLEWDALQELQVEVVARLRDADLEHQRLVLEGRLDGWLRRFQSPTQGREVLRRVLKGRFVFTPTAEGTYDCSCPTRHDRLFAGVIVQRRSFIEWGEHGRLGPHPPGGHPQGRLRSAAGERFEGDAKRMATLEGFEPSIFTLKGSRASYYGVLRLVA